MKTVRITAAFAHGAVVWVRTLEALSGDVLHHLKSVKLLLGLISVINNAKM